MKLSLSLSEASSAPWIDQDLVDKLRTIAASLGRPHDTIDLIVVDDDFIRRINRDYRGQDRPTDVISFSYIDDGDSPMTGVPADEGPAGEIYVSHQTLETEAKAQGIELKNLFLRVGVHGLLHIIGYEHKTDSQTHTMEGEEKRLLLEHLSRAQVGELFS